MKDRYGELDSMRGLASISVVFHHLSLIFVSIGVLGALGASPLHLFWAGTSAVDFFFVLSGFVLSISFFNGVVSYRGFMLRRFIRIYIPYIVAVNVALIAYQVLGRHQPIPQLSHWFNAIWELRPTPSLLFNHLLLIGDFQNFAYDPVIWSLVHEMRISIFFPLLAMMVRRLNWSTSLCIGFLVSTIGSLTQFEMDYPLHDLATDYATSYEATLRYVFMFIVGAVLAKHRKDISDHISRWSAALKTVILVGGVLLYTFPYWCVPSGKLGYFFSLGDWTVTAGAGSFLIVAIGSARAKSFLTSKPLLFMGKISYSLYLYHAICLMAIFSLLFGRVPTLAVCAVAIVCSFVLSTLAYFVIERPSVQLSHKFSSRG